MKTQYSFLQNTWACALALVAVLAVRFNRNDYFFANPGPFDSKNYISFIHYFRGEPFDVTHIGNSIRWRPLGPWLASWLPFEPMTALNVLNAILLGLAVWSLSALLIKLLVPTNERWKGIYLFIFSFPMLYYGSIGYVDPVLMGFMGLALLALYQDQWLLLVSCFVLATLAKEGSIVLLPVIATYMYFRKPFWQTTCIALGFLVTYIVLEWAMRQYMPNPSGRVNALIWKSSWEFIFYNAARWKWWVGTLLTSLPLLYLLVRFRHNLLAIRANKSVLLPLVVGFFAAGSTWIYQLFSSYSDGRPLWAMYPFLIPLVVILNSPKRASL